MADDGLKQELIQFEVELMEFEQRHDLVALEQVLADDFVLMTTKGTRLSKAKFLEFLEEARMLHFELKDVEAREIAPGIAVVLAMLDIDMSVRGEMIPRWLSLTTIWRRTDPNNWVCVYRQNAALAKQPE